MTAKTIKPVSANWVLGQVAIWVCIAAVGTRFAVAEPGSAVRRSSDTSPPVPARIEPEIPRAASSPRHLTIYVLPHSHTDIGYTEIQTAIERKQVNNLVEGMAAARRTAAYPPGARFVWNVEVLWAADLYLRRLDEQQRQDFLTAVQQGQIALNGMYLNELTGLCRPEELIQLFRCSTELSQTISHTGSAAKALPHFKIDSAMISDVPGYTWGTVTAMAQAGIKYFSAAPNFFDRIGDIMEQWQNKPFYWVSPSGREKVLVWVPFQGYAMSHIYHQFSPKFVAEFQAKLDELNYPYDIACIRWSGHGDNAVPDPAICDFVRDWNAQHEWPKFIISSTSEAFSAFEKRYGDKLPRVQGDWTPYWEDGAGSSALETALNRNTADRLTQAQALWAMLNPSAYPAANFDDAWRNVLLYSEHTWGADCSVWDPESKKTKEQWEIKRGYALEAGRQTQELLKWGLAAVPRRSPQDAPNLNTAARGMGDAKPERNPSQPVLVYNTTSWRRDDVVRVPARRSTAGDRVTDDGGWPVPSQRLSSGELAFMALNVPPLASRRYHIGDGKAFVKQVTSAKGAELDNGRLHVRLDEKTGGIAELRAKGLDANFADTSAKLALNDYLYLPGDQLTNLQGSGPVNISIKEAGPLISSLLVESTAPGCRRLTREVRLTAGLDYVELINTVDKERSPAIPKPGDHQFAQNGGKESVNFAFAFSVPEGQVNLDIPLANMNPELDQIPGSCKNWFTIGRWADVANNQVGVAWISLDAPLVEVGELSATLLGSQHNPAIWRKHVGRTQKLYSWVMNNHWGTNYRAYQEGPVVFRYALWPHGKSSPAANTRLATGLSQPLILADTEDSHLAAGSLLKLSTDSVVITGLKPSDDGTAWIIRLFGASGHDEKVSLSWGQAPSPKIWLSDTSEQPLRRMNGSIPVPAWDVVTLRADRK